MAHNKVVLGNETLIDLSGDSVTEDTLAFGVTAHNKHGEQITGEGINADTVNGWHFAVIDDGTPPASVAANTLVFVYNKNGG